MSTLGGARPYRGTPVPSLALKAFWISCLVLALDFKGQTSGGVYQIASFLVALCLLTPIAMLLSFRNVMYPNRQLQMVLLVLICYLASTLIPVLVHSIPSGNYRTMMAPYVLFFVSYWFTSLLCRIWGGAQVVDALMPALRAMLIVSLLWTLIVGFSIEGVTAADVRYRMVSVLAPFGIVYIFSSVLHGSMRPVDKVLGLVLGSVILVSQTRSYLIVTLVAFLLTTYSYSVDGTSWIRMLVRGFLAVLVASMIATLIAVATFRLFPAEDGRGIIEMWGSRLFGAREIGFDLTSATRLAEYSDQMGQLFSSLTNSLVGMGLGGSYTYSGMYAELVINVLGVGAIPEDYWNGGHSLFVYSLFSGGVVFGSLFIGAILYGLFSSIRVLVLVRRLGDRVLHHRCVVVAGSYACFALTGLMAFPLGSRPVAFQLGVLLALVIALRRAVSTGVGRVSDRPASVVS